MIILHIAPVNMTSTNGLRFSVPGLVSAQNRLEGISAGLMTIKSEAYLLSEEVNKFDFTFMLSKEKISELEPPFNNPDIVVFHGVYYKAYLNIGKYLYRKKIPFIIVPRVSLTDGAQKQKLIKKKLGNVLFFNTFIRHANKIHFLTENEKKSSSYFNCDSFTIGNGMRLPIDTVKRKHGEIRLTFIGRYDINHKGLDVLIESISMIKDELKDKNVTLNMYGSDFREGKKSIAGMIEKHNLYDVIKVNDPIFNMEKERVLQETDIFIATSRFEGHPMAVLEAMAYSIPCILTRGTNMVEKLKQYDAGWPVELEPRKIAETILKASEDVQAILEKGSNARRLVSENYTWNRVALETIKEYSKIVNQED